MNIQPKCCWMFATKTQTVPSNYWTFVRMTTWSNKSTIVLFPAIFSSKFTRNTSTSKTFPFMLLLSISRESDKLKSLKSYSKSKIFLCITGENNQKNSNCIINSLDYFDYYVFFHQ